jgi:hypothetical protein
MCPWHMTCITQWDQLWLWINFRRAQSDVNILSSQTRSLYLIWCFMFRKEHCILAFDHICQVSRWKSWKVLALFMNSLAHNKCFRCCFSKFENKSHISLYRIIFMFPTISIGNSPYICNSLDNNINILVLILPPIHLCASHHQ